MERTRHPASVTAASEPANPAAPTPPRAGLARAFTDIPTAARLEASARMHACAKLFERSADPEERAVAVAIGTRDRLIGLLDVLDRKASSLVSTNSFVLGINAFVLRDFLTLSAATTLAKHSVGWFPISAAFLSLVAIGIAVGMFRMWWIEDNVGAPSSDRPLAEMQAFYGREIEALARIAAERAVRGRVLRLATMASTALTIVYPFWVFAGGK